MTELYEAREIREGDWVLNSGVPHVFYDMKLRPPDELVVHFQEIVAEWMEAHRTAQDQIRERGRVQKALEICRADKQELIETLEETQAELDRLKKERRE